MIYTLIISLLSCIFFFSSSSIFSTIILLMSVLFMMFILSFHMGLMWVMLLYGISMVSGLMVIIAYISGVSPSVPFVGKLKSESFILFSLMVVLTFLMDFSIFIEKNSNFNIHSFTNSSIYLYEGLFMFILLLVVVVLFMRMIYSKGGGYRKKF